MAHTTGRLHGVSLIITQYVKYKIVHTSTNQYILVRNSMYQDIHVRTITTSSISRVQKWRSWSPSQSDSSMLKNFMRPSSIALFILLCRSGSISSASKSGLCSITMTFFSSFAVHLFPKCISTSLYKPVQTGMYEFVHL